MDNYEYIDLGLPSGTLWATFNVGAESIADYGFYLNYKEATECGVTLPTREQFNELFENTIYKFMVNYNNCNVCGGLFIGKNGKELFFPDNGYVYGNSQYGRTTHAFYWSSTKGEYDNTSYAAYIFSAIRTTNQYDNDVRFSVRGVKNS